MKTHHRPLLSLAFVLSVIAMAPGSVASGTPDPLVRGGERGCGLGKEFHAGRRAELRRKAGKGVLVFRGLPETRDYVAFHQDKTFWYLTGVESPNAALVIDCESKREILFLPRRNAFKEQWEGEFWDAEDDWVPELTGFDDVRPVKELLDVLDDLLADEDTPLWVSRHPHIGLMGCFDRAMPAQRAQLDDPLDGRASRETALETALAKRYERDVRDAEPILSEMRRVKTDEEIEAMRRAARAGALAMSEAMRSTRPGIGEWDLDALMSWIQRREGAAGPAYHAIVGSGPNSLVLHYSASSRVLESGEVVLIDYGPEQDHYTTDITRTWPTDGTFTEEMAKLYDAVLEAQKAGIAAAKPGVTMRSVDAACRRVLEQRGFGDLIRHGSCHYIGMEVHDVGDQRAKVEPGVAFTIEPGAYDPKTNIGIRIEDVVVITEDGCEVITNLVPKERAEIEELVASEGVLDWMDGRGE